MILGIKLLFFNKQSYYCHIYFSWKNERIVSAYDVRRPKLDSNGYSKQDKSWIDHRGLLVKTDKGNSWLIHNTPGAGVVATSGKHMSRNWKSHGQIDVNGYKTVGGVRDAARSRDIIKHLEYVGSGTCIGSSKKGRRYLENP
jgi:hypothetical protein